MEHIEQDPTDSVPQVHPVAPVGSTQRARGWKRVIQVGVGVGVAAGVAVGATALASAATSTPKGSTTPSTTPKSAPHQRQGHGFFGGRGPSGFGAMGGIGFGGFGPVLHGEATVKGPNGYETIEVQTGKVTSVSDVSGSTWSLVVTSADNSAITYSVNSDSSVNGGEMGIGSVKTGDEVSVTATVSKGTATVKNLLDTTKLQANRGSWAPQMPKSPPSGSTPTSGTSTN